MMWIWGVREIAIEDLKKIEKKMTELAGKNSAYDPERNPKGGSIEIFY